MCEKFGKKLRVTVTILNFKRLIFFVQIVLMKHSLLPIQVSFDGVVQRTDCFCELFNFMRRNFSIIQLFLNVSLQFLTIKLIQMLGEINLRSFAMKVSHQQLICEERRSGLHLNQIVVQLQCWLLISQSGIIMIRSFSATSNMFSGTIKPFLVRKIAKNYSVSTNKLTNSPLNEYQLYLAKHNQSLKKPHPKLKEAESKVISQLLQQKKYSPVISFLSNNTNLRLCNLTTTPTVDKILASQYSKLDQNDRVSAAFALVSFRQTSFFNIFREELQSKVQQGNIESISIEQLIVYLFGQLIVHKSIRFISKLQINNSNVTLDSLHQRLIHSNYKGSYIKQFVAVTQYISLLLNPQNNKIEELSAPPKKKSLLEIDVGAFLHVLGYSHKDQMTVNNFKVDFVVDKIEGQPKKVALQVNGNYHYTLSGKTKGRQIIRNLIVNEGLPLRIVHHQDYLLSRGHRNKQAYIQKILHSSEVNWECRHQGMDSGWQVTDTQNL